MKVIIDEIIVKKSPWSRLDDEEFPVSQIRHFVKLVYL